MNCFVLFLLIMHKWEEAFGEQAMIVLGLVQYKILVVQ